LIRELPAFFHCVGDLRNVLARTLADSRKVDPEHRYDLSRAVLQFARNMPPFLILPASSKTQ
jgi:hypothetical protein